MSLAHMSVKERCRGNPGPVGVVGPEGVGRDVEVVGRPTGLVSPIVVGEGAVTDVDHRRGGQFLTGSPVSSRVGEQGPVEAGQQLRIRRPGRPDRSHRLSRGGLEHGHQPRHSTLHQFLVDDVSLVHPRLRVGSSYVVDFDGQGGPWDVVPL